MNNFLITLLIFNIVFCIVGIGVAVYTLIGINKLLKYNDKSNNEKDDKK